MQALKKGCIRDGLGHRRGTKEGTEGAQKGIFSDFSGYKKGEGKISRGAHKDIANDNYINIYRKNKSFLYR